MSAFSNIHKLNIGSDDSNTAANRASRINSLVSRMFARANGTEGLASQIKASSSQALLKSDDNMVQTTLINASTSIRSSSYSTQNVKVKSKGKKAAAFKLDAAQSTLRSTSIATNGSKEASIGLAKQQSLNEQPTTSAQANTAAAGSDSSSSIPRRNLFGIRLNHDQLKQDLKDMWRDQLEQQKQRWNFDFETLRPTSKAAPQSADPNERFKWTRVTYYVPGLPQNTMAHSGFDRNELFNNSQGDYEDYESDTEQEDDDALAMPQFYKYQRRLKFNDEPNRIKMMTITVSQAPSRKSPTIVNERLAESETKKSETNVEKETKTAPQSQMTFEPIFKMALKNSQTQQPSASEKKPETAKKSTKTTTIRRPKAIKRTQPTLQQSSLALSPSTQNLIITFSENRKDTLRSASVSNTASTVTLTSKVKLAAKEGETAFVSTQATKAVTISSPTGSDSMKQQSLLDIFKQRKRRNTTVSGKPSHQNDDLESGKHHETRSHSMAHGRENDKPTKSTGSKASGRQSRITSSGINVKSLRSHSSSAGSKGYCKIFLRNGAAKVN